MVEALNTEIEVACNAITREYHADIKLAKDCGSLAVLLSGMMAASIWGLAMVEKLSWPPALGMRHPI